MVYVGLLLTLQMASCGCFTVSVLIFQLLLHQFIQEPILPEPDSLLPLGSSLGRYQHQFIQLHVSLIVESRTSLWGTLRNHLSHIYRHLPGSCWLHNVAGRLRHQRNSITFQTPYHRPKYPPWRCEPLIFTAPLASGDTSSVRPVRRGEGPPTRRLAYRQSSSL